MIPRPQHSHTLWHPSSASAREHACCDSLSSRKRKIDGNSPNPKHSSPSTVETDQLSRKRKLRCLNSTAMEPNRTFLVLLLLFTVVVPCFFPFAQANGFPRTRLSSIIDANGEWRLHSGERELNFELGLKSSEEKEDVKIWPMPASVAHGESTLLIPRSFAFEGLVVSETLRSAFLRYYDVMFGQHARHPVRYETKTTSRELTKLVVAIGSLNEEFQYGVDESYTLDVPDGSESNTAYLEASTVYGALRGLETFSQLTTFNFKEKSVQITKAPYTIKDFPRFSYRGLLIDTSRHYQPVSSIKRVLDSMEYSKLNVLHWHIVDEESFPMEIPSYPLLWKGSYSNAERYTMDDARELVEYARLRGIHIMPELDVPGHAASWGVGYPDLWPGSECLEPLDVSNDFTFDVISGIIGDFRAVFPFNFAHLGGDEVNTSCWESISHIKTWLDHRNSTTKEAYADFVIRVQEIANKHDYVPVNWEETFRTFPSQLRKETVVHNWLQGGVCAQAVKKGFRCILSDQATWYLDHLDAPWDKFYNTEPLLNITDPDEQSLVLGGEVCMWGETVDGSNILQTIWPRAAAAAERLWSPLDFTSQGATPALKRFQDFRCLLNRRGIAAAPVFNGRDYAYGRGSPRDPGSCFEQ